MDIESIEKFLSNHTTPAKVVNVHFKDRSTIAGVFVELKDYSELKAKNFWRLVYAKNIDQWENTRNADLSKLFNGGTFTRLSIAK